MVKSEISKAVEEVYDWIESQGIDHTCTGCGDCCNFTEYDHLLFVTGVELIHFAEAIGRENIKAMPNGICPYMTDGKCTVYKSRFAGCRIFQCKGNDEQQGEVMEKALAKLKLIGEKFGVDYSYIDLARGLESLEF
ncbi:MAG: YkgJ family cysteine cluster protein [Phycisphaerae bacterium]|nr:YkgJ family cysteine cluster protein [Phycisphaerae bacterium]